MVDENEASMGTCGAGLAANADLPALLGRLLAAQADVFEQHARALDPADPAARPELDAYAALQAGHRAAGGALTELAESMADCRDLPMAPHDLAVMTDPAGQPAAFRRFVELERDLAELLRAKLADAENLLG
jgi:hypothetical protein